MEKEIWKDVPNYEGYYQVSNLGNVKSLGNNKFNQEMILKPGLNRGYCAVKLCKDGKNKTFKVHQLVAMTFLKHIPDGTNKVVVDHKDGNPLNNRLDNLQLISQRENLSKERTTKSGLPVGVYFRKDKNKYQAQIHINGKQIYLGLFNTPEEASEVYQSKLKKK